MEQNLSADTSHVRVRDGTAQRKRGRDRVRIILAAARHILLKDGYAALTLRKVAARANISLGNLGYYFSSKDDLFQSLLDDVLLEYKFRWEEILAKIPDDPEARFLAIMDYHLADCRRRETQNFFYQLWALSTHDAFVAKCRDSAYRPFYDQMFELCVALNPTLDRESLGRRVYLLMAMVEGLHVMFGNHSQTPRQLATIDEEFCNQALRIVCSPT